jgi:cell division septation protein DedD
MSSAPSSVLRRSRSARFSSSPALLSAACAALALPLLLTGCSRASAGTTVTTASPQAIESAREQMDLIPPPSKTRYMAIHSLESWENPYLTVQENMATLHVTLADANPSDLGAGGMLRPVGARRQNVTVRVSDLPAALNAIPENAWPYGRVVAVEEAHDAPASARPAIRRNVEAAIKTLGDLGVVVYEWNDGVGQR